MGVVRGGPTCVRPAASGAANGATDGTVARMKGMNDDGE
jgi:hypothetical protein